MNLDVLLCPGDRNELVSNDPTIFKKLDSHFNSSKSTPDLIMFSEYAFWLDDIIRDIEDISSFAQNYNCNIIMAPKGSKTNGNLVSWNRRKSQLINTGVAFEEGDLLYHCEVMGLWFYANGNVLGFAKDIAGGNIHKIPSTDFGVGLCWELQGMSSIEDDIKVLLNPCRIYESYKIYNKVWGRTRLMAKKDSNTSGTTYPTNNHIRSILPVAQEKNILILGCDTDFASGVTYIPNNLKVTYAKNERLSNSNYFCKRIKINDQNK